MHQGMGPAAAAQCKHGCHTLMTVCTVTAHTQPHLLSQLIRYALGREDVEKPQCFSSHARKRWVLPKLLEFERKKVISKGKREKEGKGRKKWKRGREEERKGKRKRGRAKEKKGKRKRGREERRKKKIPPPVKMFVSGNAGMLPELLDHAVTALLRAVVLVVSKAVFQQKREHFYQLREEKPEVK